MSAFGGVAVQTDVRCASGGTVAVFEPHDLIACTATLSPTDPESLTVSVPRDDVRAATLVPGRVVRTLLGGTADREWDIVAVQDATDANRRTVTAQPIALRLGHALLSTVNGLTGAPEFRLDDTQATLTQLIDDRVLPALAAAGLGWIARGTVEPTARVDVSAEWVTALEYIRLLCEPGRGDCEWRLRRNGAVDYRLDLLTEIGSDAPVITVRTAVNLLETRRERDVAELATRIYPRGSQDATERTMARHLWAIKSVVSATDLELEDLAGGAGPIAWDGQLDGTFLSVLTPTFASQAISASVAATQRVTVASTTGMTAGQRVRIFQASGATAPGLTALRQPQAALAPAAGGFGDRARVLDLPALVGTTNLVPNAWMRAWANAANAPDGWTFDASTPANLTRSRETATVRDGQVYAWRLQTTGETTVRVDTPAIALWNLPEARYVPALWFYIDAAPAAPVGALVFELVHADTGALLAELGRYVLGGTPDLDTWIRLVPEARAVAYAHAVRLRLRVTRTNAATAESGWNVIVGPALLAESEVPVADVEFSGGAQLWQAANRALAEAAQVARGYDLRVLDLARDQQDAGTLPLVPGATVQLTDTTLDDAVALRLLEVRPDYLNPLATQVRVGVSPRELAGELLVPGQPPARPVPGTVAQPAQLALRVAVLSDAYEIRWSGQRVVERSIDGGAWVALTASPEVAPREPFGGPVRSYLFRATGDRPDDTVLETVLVLPQEYVPPATPVFSSVGLVTPGSTPGDGGGQTTVSWTLSSAPTGAEVTIDVQAIAGTPISDGFVSAGPFAYTASPQTVSLALGPGAVVQVTLRAFDGATLVASRVFTAEVPT